MNFKQLILPAVALSATALLLIPASTQAFVFLGGSLNTTQRDFRVHNNFTDPTANDNVVAEVNFPGADGAELAIWKACTEWGSMLHGGTGSGDPHQAFGLGSGGANFDAVWIGGASGPGTTNGNIFSELAGGDGGTLAFCESPISDGWRIRFYSDWTWHDGPGTAIAGQDIQGIATHEYGHALGLDHTGVNGSTMLAGVFGSGVNSRSIGADDIAGVQALYGVMASTKPRITGISFGGGLLTIHGFNFDLLSNEVWFTQSAIGFDTPATITGVASNGSSITVAIPFDAGSGDVFVKLPSATTGSTLSNGWPINLASIPPAPGFAYCFGDGSLPTPCPCALPDTVPSPSGGSDAGCANSFQAVGGRLDAAGSKSPADQVVLTASLMSPTGFCFFIVGNANDANGVANGDGLRCAGGGIIRFGSQNAVNGGAYYPNRTLNLTTPISTLGSTPVGSGLTAYYQTFYRNATAGFCNGATSNMTSAYQITWN